MIKLIFSNVEDISKAATFLEWNFIKLYLEFCRYLSIAGSSLRRFEISGHMPLDWIAFNTSEKKSLH